MIALGFLSFPRSDRMRQPRLAQTWQLAP